MDGTQIPFIVCINCKRIVAKIELLKVHRKIVISIVYISINLVYADLHVLPFLLQCMIWMHLFILHNRVLQGLHALQFLLGAVVWLKIQTPSLFYHPAMFCTLNYRTFLIVRLVLHNKKGARMRRRFRVQTIYEVLWPIAYFIRTRLALNTRIRECYFTRKKV